MIYNKHEERMLFTTEKQQMSMKKHFSFALAAVLALALIATLISSPFTADSEEFTQEDAASLDAAREKLEQINERQAELSSSLKKYSNEKNSEVKAKQTLEQQITETESKIETIEWIIDNLEARLEEKNAELEQAQQEYEDYHSKYVSRIRENYEMGTTTYLEVIIMSENFSDMLTRYDYIRDMMDYDNQILVTMCDNIAFIESIRAEIIADYNEQQEMLALLSAEKTSQAAQIVDLKDRIDYISKNIAQLQEEQEEFERLEAEFEKQINELLDKKKKYAGGAFMWPLESKYSRISSGFGWRKLYGKDDFHYAIDIPADKGAPVYAAADGTIIYYGWTNTGGGNKCVIDHGSKLMTHYNHMSAFVPELQKQFKENGSVEVKKGDVIGYVGSTGNSTGNHLDFKILYDGTAYNPALYVTPDGSKPEKDIMDLIN
ncbi:MAG: peptidoglycan DD-metalloendopeptidase family protein [Clostridia bacterium]|nr:peptidoglycan DD-metalloendopeptidase family protein [Clostridia bacterium]